GRRRRRRRGRRSGEGREGAPQDRDRMHEPVGDLAAAAGEPDESGADEGEDAGDGADGSDAAAESAGDGDRRRRRRGRRGGRRNRRGREGEGFAPDRGSEGYVAGNGSAVESELAQAVADLDGRHVVEPEASSPHSAGTDEHSTQMHSEAPAPAADEPAEPPLQAAGPEA